MQRKWLIAIPLMLALLVVCVAIVATAWFTLARLGGDFKYNLDLGGPLLTNFDTKLTGEESQSYPVETPASLIVDAACASVSLSAAETGQIRIDLHKTAWGRDEPEAARSLDLIQLGVTQTGDQVSVALLNPEQVCQQMGGLGPEIVLTITAPARTRTQIETGTGAIALQGFLAESDLTTGFGDITVTDLSGRLSARTSNGRIQASRIRAGEERLELRSTFGELGLQDAQAGELTLATENGAVRLNDLQIEGAAGLKSQFGAIRWSGGSARELDIKTSNGAVALENLALDGVLSIRTDFGALGLTGVAAESYDLVSLNGDIVLDGATGPVKASSDFGELRILLAGPGEPSAFDLSSKNGAITFEGPLGRGESQALSEFGPVRLVLPEDAQFDFDLQTDFGSLKSDFEMTMQGQLDQNHWVGQVGGGGPLVKVKTINGNIMLERQGE